MKTNSKVFLGTTGYILLFLLQIKVACFLVSLGKEEICGLSMGASVVINLAYVEKFPRHIVWVKNFWSDGRLGVSIITAVMSSLLGVAVSFSEAYLYEGSWSVPIKTW